MLETTLGVIVKDNKIFLGEKMKGFAKGVLNGIGGKREGNESMGECMKREAYEEIGINIVKQEDVGIMHFNFNDKPELNLVVYIYNILEYTGNIIESVEIKPFWFNLNDIPYNRMWEFDKYWLPRILNGEKNLEYNVWYDKEKGTLLKFEKIK